MRCLDEKRATRSSRARALIEGILSQESRECTRVGLAFKD
jgi:hypothetical protein